MRRVTAVACKVSAVACLCVAAFAPATVGATPSMQECLEGSDFIANAALSRDNGIPADQFLDRLEGDFMLVRSFPNELRWFVHDADDEALLLESARRVYGEPLPPESHRRIFLDKCLERIAMEVPGSDSVRISPPTAGH